jgi:HKD family nuclease
MSEAFRDLMSLKNLQEKVLDKNRSELRKKGIENIADLLLRIGERYKRLAYYGSICYL